jgi:hypothetical protein
VRELDIAQQVLIERRVGEGQDGVWDVMPRGLDRNVIVLFEVDAGMLFRRIINGTKQVPFKTRVRRAWNMLSISPLAVTGAAGVAAATTTAAAAAAACWGAIGIRVEASLRATTTPAATAATAGSSTGRGRTGWRRAPIARGFVAIGVVCAIDA